MEEPPPANARRHVSNDDSAPPGDDDDDDIGAVLLPGPAGALADPAAGLRTLRARTACALRSWLALAGKLIKRRGPTADDVAATGLDELDGPAALPAPGPVAGPLRDMLFSSWLNVLLVFVPFGLASHLAGMGPVVVFASNAAAIVPLSALLTDATERVAAHAGDTVGALLNISLGNLVELILFVALAHNHVRIVEASILGSVLVNLLLILGSALVVGSATNGEPSYNAADAQLLACLLFVSVFTFLMPTAFNYTFGRETRSGLISLKLSRISSLLILAIYGLYLIHEIRSRRRRSSALVAVEVVDLESRLSSAEQRRLPPPLVPLPSPVSMPQAPSPRIIRFADHHRPPPGGRFELGSLHVPDYNDHPASDRRGRQRGIGDGFQSRAESWQPPMPSRKHSPSLSLRSGCLSRDSSVGGDVRRAFPRSSLTLQMLGDGRLDREQPPEDRHSGSSAAHEVLVAISMLVFTSGLMSINAELLVGTIDDVTRQTNLSEPVIGLILLPIVGNIAEYVTVVAVAAREKLDLAIAVAVGSSIQIALCVTPLTVLAGWTLHRDLALTFNMFEIATLVGGVLLVNLLVLNETGNSLRSGGLKGALMCACYFMIGLGAYFAPAIEV